jgi:hypothetical protein
VDVWYLWEAAVEQRRLPMNELLALRHALEKLEAYGPLLPAPHQKHVVGAERLRELRPRAGRSRFRAFYRQVGDAMLIAAIGPEYQVDRIGFQRAVRVAEQRLRAFEED